MPGQKQGFFSKMTGSDGLRRSSFEGNTGLKGAIEYTEIETTIEGGHDDPHDPSSPNKSERQSRASLGGIASLKTASLVIEKRYKQHGQDQLGHNRAPSASSSLQDQNGGSRKTSDGTTEGKKASGIGKFMGKLNANQKAAGALGSFGGMAPGNLPASNASTHTRTPKINTANSSKISLGSLNEGRKGSQGSSTDLPLRNGHSRDANGSISGANGVQDAQPAPLGGVKDVNKIAEHLASLSPFERKVFLDGYLMSKGITRSDLAAKTASGVSSPRSNKTASPIVSPKLGIPGAQSTKDTPGQASVRYFEEEEDEIALPTTSDVGLATRNAALQRKERLNESSPKDFASEW